MNKKVALLILDGWGLGTKPEVSAIAQANTPFMDSLWATYPHSKLEASGLAVGLPEGQMGNSEVGHMNIGAGRVVYQDLVRINKAVAEHTLEQNIVLINALKYAKENHKALHLLVYCLTEAFIRISKHLKALCGIAKQAGVEQIFVHAFMDGRDTAPDGGVAYLQDLLAYMEAHQAGKVASIIGRYYAMDRDKRWERVKLAYDLLVHGEGLPTQNVVESLQLSYKEGVTDEFVKPIVCTDTAGKSLATIQEGDVVLFFNFRNDRGRQLTQALSQEDFPDFGMKKLDLRYLTMTIYDEAFHNVQVMFEKDNLHATLGEIVAQAGKTQIRIAETEKYPHVTFFFSGGREQPFAGESRILCPSPKVATYDLKPEMSAADIRDAIVPEIQKQSADFICLNFANADMVGHTGVFEAAVKACETVDTCLQAVVTAALEQDYICIIIADHGNSDIMRNDDGSPNTAHTTNLVPCILVHKDYKPTMKNGKLGDLAPTILKLMGIDIPKEMTGDVLIG